MNLMHCGKTVVLSYDKIEKNQQLMSFVRQLGCEIIYIKPKNLYLVVISSKETKGSNVLHYKEGFKEEWAPKMKIITGANMRDNIYTLQSNRDLSPF